jgi:predicted dehydrogenase/threonine dehydrogenase-like Zn-dependent dehydrogenase
MRQVLQSLRSGQTEVADVPAPGVSPGHLLIRTSHTLISAGTERMLVDFGKANVIDKARQQPDKVKQVLEKVKTDGLATTIDAVLNKLDQPLALGYCQTGVVIDIGAGVEGFAKGDRVVSSGKHAEIVNVPVNLAAHVPDGVDAAQAAFTPLAAIALQGIRLIQPTFGETTVVTGLGLIGLMAVQLLRANGCRVIGLDFDASRCALARRWGAETVELAGGANPVQAVMAMTRGRGVDAVLVTASTDSSLPIRHAAQMSRQRGRIVLVGVTGLELVRDDFYKKELSFQVSSSYGPGRYDPVYEEKGQDYPLGFVRWTVARNFEAVLDHLSRGTIDFEPLITHRIAIDEAERAYAIVSSDRSALGIVLEYPQDIAPLARTVMLETAPAAPAVKGPRINVIGAGNYAGAVLIPAFKAGGAVLRSIASGAGVTARHAGRKFGFAQATTDTQSALTDSEADAIVIATRHDTHARFARIALEAGRDVFVEKPMCLTFDELADLERMMAAAHAAGRAPRLMVGFNRRFAPHVRHIKELLRGVSGPRTYVMTINAGAIPVDHWTQDHGVGGGRIIGEGCHFVDLLRFLAASPIVGWDIAVMSAATPDTAVIRLSFADGSLGSIHYLANGNKAFPKERLEVFAGGRVVQLDNYRRLVGYGWSDVKPMRLWRQDKGQAACAAAFLDAIRLGIPSPIPFAELVEVHRVTIALGEAAAAQR